MAKESTQKATQPAGNPIFEVGSAKPVKSPIRCGIVGLGRIGWCHHAQTISQHGGFELAAVCDVEAERLDEAKALANWVFMRKHSIFLSLSALLVFGFAPPQSAAQRTSLAAGAKSPAKIGVDFDLQGFIDGEIKAGRKLIVVPPGRYRVRPRNREHLGLRDLKDVQIIADGVELICTETTRALTIAGCKNLTLRGLTIDYDPLPFTQGRITALSPDKTVHDIEIFDGYPSAKTAINFKYEIFQSDTRTLRCEAPGLESVEALDAKHLRLTKNRGSAADPEQIGDIIAIGSETAPGGSIPHAVVTEKSAGVRLENIDLWASNCFGFLEYECDATTYQRCRIDRRPAKGDLVVRGDARIRSLDADAFHSKHAIKGPQLINCVAKFMGDDAVNICGNYHMVTAGNGAELRVLAKDKIFAVGEPVELWSYAGVRLPDAKVLKIEPDGKINEDERAFLLKQRMNESIRTKWNADAYKVTLERAVQLPQGSLIASTKRMGNGFLVQGCDFGFNRSRGILIKASDGKVIGNKISGSRMMAILVAPEYWWLESGSSNNVEISGNTITDCLDVGIEVVAHAGTGKLAPSGAHRKIVISGNKISNSPLPNIVVTSTSELRIEGNSITPSAGKISDWSLHMLDLKTAKLEAVMTSNCEAPLVQGNKIK